MRLTAEEVWDLASDNHVIDRASAAEEFRETEKKKQASWLAASRVVVRKGKGSS